MLVAPPFAEEMNKCRRSITTLSLLLCRHGIATVVPDLYGTGDSEGEFGAADLPTWSKDLNAAGEWAETLGCRPTTLLAIRLGAAIAAHALSDRTLQPFERTVLWQPVWDGDRFLTQFLRLRIAAGLMEDRKESVAELRRRINDGEPLEVAGYELSSTLFRELSSLKSDALPASLGRLLWCEVGRGPTEGLSAGSRQKADRYAKSHGPVAVRTEAFDGEPFWMSTETVVNAALLEATCRAFDVDDDGRAGAPT